MVSLASSQGCYFCKPIIGSQQQLLKILSMIEISMTLQAAARTIRNLDQAPL